VILIFLKNIYLFLVALGLHCYARVLVMESRGLHFVAVHGLLIAVASLIAEHRL